MITFSSQISSNDRANLRQALERRFNLDELETLAFDLGVDYSCLPHATTIQLSRELVYYFERRGSIYDLIFEALRRRDDEVLKSLSMKLIPSFPRKKVQIITAPDVRYDRDKLRNDVAASLGISPDDVEIIGSALSSLRLLVSLPQQAADMLVKSEVDELIFGGNQVISITAFDSLDTTSQEAWRIVIRKGSIQPISWKSILGSVDDNLTPERSREHFEGMHIIGGVGDDVHTTPTSTARLRVSQELAESVPLPQEEPAKIPLGERLISQRLIWPPKEPPLVIDAPPGMTGLMPDFLGVRQLSVQNRVYNVKPLVGDEPVQLRPRQNYWVVPLEGAEHGELVLVREQARPDQAEQFVVVSEPTALHVWIDKADATEGFTHLHSLGAEREWIVRDTTPEHLDLSTPRIIGIVEAILIPS
jgi:hypothetical protein